VKIYLLVTKLRSDKEEAGFQNAQARSNWHRIKVFNF